LALEILKTIQQVEAEGEDLYKQSLEAARELVKETDREVEQMAVKMQQEAQKDAEAKFALAEKEAETEIQTIMQANEAECDRIRGKAKSNMDEAAGMIVERIVKSLGNH